MKLYSIPRIFCRLLLSAGMVLGVSSTTYAESVKVSSPDGKITVTVSDEGSPHYAISFNDKTVLTQSKLGMAFKSAPSFGDGFKINTNKTTSHQSDWVQPWG